MRNFQKRPKNTNGALRSREGALAAVGLAAGAVAALLYRGRNHAAQERADSQTVADPLATYIHDHLAGAAGAIDMLTRLRDDHDGDRLSRFAGGLLADIEDDRAVLRDLADRTGGRQNLAKESGAWLAAKASKLKIGRSAAGDFGSMQALEVLGLGIQGKISLWQTLEKVAPTDRRLTGYDFRKLGRRAENQFREVEKWRMSLVGSVFSDAVPTGT
jgi:hypothetical protein